MNRISFYFSFLFLITFVHSGLLHFVRFLTFAELVAYFSLDEESGNISYNSVDSNQTITFVSDNQQSFSIPLGWVPGKIKNGYYFNQTNKIKGVFLFPQLSNMSLTFWMKTSASSNSSGNQYWEGLGLVAGDINYGANNWGVTMLFDQLAFGIGGTNDKTLIDTSGTTLNTGNWTFVSVTSKLTESGRINNIYVDGVLKANGTFNNSDLANGINFFLGCVNSTDNYFDGILDEIKIHNVELSIEEINDEMNNITSDLTTSNFDISTGFSGDLTTNYLEVTSESIANTTEGLTSDSLTSFSLTSSEVTSGLFETTSFSPITTSPVNSLKSENSNSSDKHYSASSIVGILIGIVLFLVIVGMAVFFVLKNLFKRKKATMEDTEMQPIRKGMVNSMSITSISSLTTVHSDTSPDSQEKQKPQTSSSISRSISFNNLLSAKDSSRDLLDKRGILLIMKAKSKSFDEKKQVKKTLGETTIPQLIDLRIKEKLDVGIFGEVYSALWSATLVTAKKLVDGTKAKDIEKELLTLTNLGIHPNIEQFFGFFTAATKEEYMVFEFCRVGSLLSYLKSDNNIPVYQLFRIIADICSGMEFLESKKIVHRDLKAKNCLVTIVDRKIVVKVSNFGIAKLTKDYYATNSEEIPVRWMAPESLKKGKYTTASDVWSFGVTVNEVFSFGNPPYSELTNQDVQINVQKGLLRPTKLDICPEDLWDVFNLCFTMTPENRPSFKDINLVITDYLQNMNSGSSLDLLENELLEVEDE